MVAIVPDAWAGIFTDKSAPAGPADDAVAAQELKSYAPIKTACLRPWGTGKFSLYVRKGQGLVLFATRGGAFTQDQLRRLLAG